MHFRTHVKKENRHPGNDEYTDGMIEHDGHVGELLKLIDELGLADNTIVQYSTDNGPHYNTWPDAGTMPFRGEKNSNWEGAFRAPCFIKWPGHFPAGITLNGIVAHEDWLPTFAAAAGAPDIKEKLLKGVELNGRKYKNYLDGYNLLDYLSGKSDKSPRSEFIYVNDGGEIVAIRVDDWKAVYLENRAKQLQVWREPFIQLRLPLLFNLRRDPFERAQENSNTYPRLDDRPSLCARSDAGDCQQVSIDPEGLSTQSNPWRLEPSVFREADQEHERGREVARFDSYDLGRICFIPIRPRFYCRCKAVSSTEAARNLAC